MERFAGDFCFAIWDARERTLFCARDQMGVKPLFYALKNNLFVFSNTLECLRRHPAVVRWQGKVVGAIYCAVGIRLALQER